MSECFFIRNDDVWTLAPDFRFFFSLAIDHGIPVIHAVIPGKMDKGLIRFLNRTKEKTPQLLDIVQHGWMHANHSGKIGIKYEFGASRALRIQQEDIKRGLKKMVLAFGKNFTPAFVPPYHGYDQRTLKVLYQEGFGIFSAGKRSPGLQKRIIDLPAQFSFSRYDQGHTSIRPARDMIAALTQHIYRREMSGILTHHADFAGREYRWELTRFFGYMAALKSKHGWRALLFSEIFSEKSVSKDL